jgi:hypothetical protein
VRQQVADLFVITISPQFVRPAVSMPVQPAAPFCN